MILVLGEIVVIIFDTVSVGVMLLVVVLVFVGWRVVAISGVEPSRLDFTKLIKGNLPFKKYIY